MSPNPPAVLPEPSRGLRPGEALVAWGLVLLAITVALVFGVMLWVFALMTLPLAAVLLAVGAVLARNSSASGLRQWSGFGLLSLGLVALAVAAVLAASLSCRLAIPVPPPALAARSYAMAREAWEWARFVGSCLLPVLLVGPGLGLWTDWSRRRRIAWCAVILSFPVATLLLHQTLVGIGLLALSA